jgi:hypothetical protein
VRAKLAGLSSVEMACLIDCMMRELNVGKKMINQDGDARQYVSEKKLLQSI